MDNISLSQCSSYSRSTSPRPTPSSSFSSNAQDSTPPRLMDRSSNVLLSQLVSLLTAGDTLVCPLLETLLEYHRNSETTQRVLREERDESQRVLEEQRVRADTSERERNAAREQLQNLSRELEAALATNNATQQQLHERGERLADAESLVGRKQAALDEIYEHCT
ncbi:hypothetical protein BDV06DRAFT_144382 [Aspergillus oleicola]